MDLIQKTINAHIKHFGLKLKDTEYLYKGDMCIFTLPINNRKEALFNFLEGLSSGLDNQGLFNK